MPDFTPRDADTLDDFKTGMIIRHKNSAQALVVTGNYGSHVTAVRTQDIQNPSEWIILSEGRE